MSKTSPTKSTKRPAKPGALEPKPPAVRSRVKAGRSVLDRPGGGC